LSDPTSHVALENSLVNGAKLDATQTRHNGLLCIAIGTDPAGRERRIKIREAGNSFILIDNRRHCRVDAHWSCRMTEEDIVKEVWFVFRVKVTRFEYLDDADFHPSPNRKRGRHWKSWGRRTALTSELRDTDLARAEAPL
jgi:hypothetical protein